MGESEIEATLGAEAFVQPTQGESTPRPVKSKTRPTRDAARSREITSQGATPSIPGGKQKMLFITLSPSTLRSPFKLMWWIKLYHNL